MTEIEICAQTSPRLVPRHCNRSRYSDLKFQSTHQLIPKPVPPLAVGLAASYILGMYPARKQKNDERRPGDLEAENEKLKAELEELKEIHAEKNQMFAELNEINIRLQGKLVGGEGHPFAHELAKMPLFFEGELNKEMVFRNSVLEVENRKLKGVKRKSDKNLEVKINRELNTKYKILQVENRNLRSVIGELEESFKGEINKELNAKNFTLEVKNEKLESEIEKLEEILESEIEKFEDTSGRNKLLVVENRRLKADIESPETEEDGDMGEWLMKAIAVVLALCLIYGFFFLLVTQWANSSNQPN